MPCPVEMTMPVSPAGRRLFWAVLLLGTALRLYPLNNSSLWYDEAGTMFLSQYADAHFSIFDTDKNTDAPIFLYIMRGWSALVDGVFQLERTSAIHDFLLRLFSCLMGIACMPLLYRIALAAAGNAGAALAAMFLFAISPFHVYYAHEVRNYTLWTAWNLVTLWCLLRAFDTKRRKYWIAMTLSMASLMYLHYASIWLLCAYNAYFCLIVWGRWERLRPWVCSQIAVLALIAPCILLAMKISGYFDNIPHAWYVSPTWKTGLITIKALFAGYGPSAAAYWAVFGVIVLLFCAGAFALWARWDRLALLLAIAFVPIGASVLVWSHRDFPLYEHRLFACSGAVACILAGAGLNSLPRWVACSCVGLLSAATVPCLADTYADRIHPVEMHRIGIWSRVDYRSAARHLNGHFQDGDILGHPGHFSWYSMRYYYPGEQTLIGHTKAEDEAFAANFGHETVVRNCFGHVTPVQQLAKRVRRIWLIQPHGLTFEDPLRVATLRRWLELHGIREDYQTFDGVTLTCYRIRPEMPGGLRNQIADLGEAPLAQYLDSQADDTKKAEFLREAKAVLSWPRKEWGARFPIEMVEKGDFPQESAGNFKYPILFSNPSENPHRIQYEVLESAAVAESCAFDFSDPETTVWERNSQYNPALPMRPFDAPAIMAHMRGANGEGDIIRAWAELPPGRYEAHARMLECAEAKQFSLGQAEFRIGADMPFVAEANGVSPGTNGWKWRTMGAFDWPGGRMPIEVACRNCLGFADAFVHLDRVLFTQVPEVGQAEPWRSTVSMADLDPNSEVRLELTGSMGSYPRKRVDIEFSEEGSPIRRLLTFHVAHTAQP